MTSDYGVNLPLARRTHRGTVAGAFQAEFRETRTLLARDGITRNWWAYQGRQIRPFIAYTRFQPGRLTISVLAGDTERAKRMPVICQALDTLAWRESLTLRFESIIHAGLRDFLLARGYRYADGNPSPYPDLIFDPARP